MISAGSKLVNRCVGRPSFYKAAVCSLAMHALVVSAGYFFWLQPVTQSSMAGRRYVTQLEVKPFPAVTVPPVEITTPSAEAKPRFLSRSDLVSHDRQPPRPVPVMRRRVTQGLPLSADGLELPDACVDESRLEISGQMRSVIESEIPPHVTLSQPERRPLQSPTPPSPPVVQQVVGIDDKQLPDLSGNRPPPYPAEAVRLRLQGTVLLRLHISETGVVERVEIVRSSGHDVLDQAAATTVRNWRGQPAYHRGRAIATRELLPIRFRL